MGEIFTTLDEKNMCMFKLIFNVCDSNFPGGLVVMTLCLHCRGCRFDPWSGKFYMLQDVTK